jgi:hypothetical protein
MEIDNMTEVGNLHEAKRDWERLLENPAWIQLMGAVQAQTDSLQQDILFSPISSESDLFMCERKKGMLEGRLSLTATAQALVESVQLDLNLATKEKEK